MLSINTNLSSLIAQHSMNKSTIALNQAIERMTTGFKINHAKDNAANYSISKNMSTQISSYNVAQDNCAMGLDMLTTAEENLNLITDKLQRLRDLQIQASNGTYGEQSLQAINAEANALVDEIERIYANAEYNGKKLFEKAETQAVAEVATYGARAATSGKFINEVTHRNTDGMTKLSSITDESVELASGTYSISTPAELEKLARLTNTGKLNSSSSYEFVLAKDIDMSSVSNWVPIGNDMFGGVFSGVFDGNGYAIKNLTIKNRTDIEYASLFAFVKGAIKNLGVENINIENSGTSGAYGIAAVVLDGAVENCYTTGNINSLGGAYGIGLLVGAIDCYSTVTLSSDRIGDDSAILGISMTSDNSFFAGKIIMDVPIDAEHVALPAINDEADDGHYTTNYYVENWTDPETIAELNAYLQDSGESIDYGISKSVAELEAMYGIDLSSAPSAGGGTGGGGTGGGTGGGAGGGAGTGGGAGSSVAGDVSLQVGINSDSSSQISLEFSFSLAGVDGLRMIGLDTTTDYLKKLDNMLSIVSAKQTEYGAAQNRLESALESIEVNIENLTSSLSTIRDADISEVSSDYIRQQILQQASATLLATANQSPSIALQLI